ncbi:MAG: hypothetical protein KatS3mg126_0276 [Lysobacteraceae bacterium]|nr:MAG: hypothetical protein KatS3mg126_0276 [Xanthomonadaceae bacterium]
MDLILGLRLARRFGLPLISDLGDPVLAPYTPRWRRALHRSLERSVLAASASVLVTNDATRELLCRRHGVDRSRITVLSQGYSEDVALEAVTAQRPSGLPLKLFYSGSLYRGLRSAAPVFEALSRIEDVELVIAGDAGEEGVPAGGRVRFVGRLSHADVLEWQRRSDVLLSIGNAGTVQVPGKIFEYFGARRPILHVATDPADACVSLVASLRRGVCCTAEPEQIVAVLTRLRQLKLDGQLDASFELGLKSVEEYSWKRIGDRLSQLCDRVVQGRGHAS